VSSTTGLIFSYAIGLIFLVGGLIFIFFLDEQNLTFGIPYLLLGATIVYGMYSGRKRRKRREAREAAALVEQTPEA
jgi:Ca2+/Na+ antiporter